MDAITMRVVVKTVVTPKSGLTTCYHCESWIIGGRRVYFRPYIYHNIVKAYCYQQVNPVFQVTTELTTDAGSGGRAPPDTTIDSWLQLGRWETVSLSVWTSWPGEEDYRS
jgi:hypothetical protein